MTETHIKRKGRFLQKYIYVPVAQRFRSRIILYPNDLSKVRKKRSFYIESMFIGSICSIVKSKVENAKTIKLLIKKETFKLTLIKKQLK